MCDLLVGPRDRVTTSDWAMLRRFGTFIWALSWDDLVQKKHDRSCAAQWLRVYFRCVNSFSLSWHCSQHLLRLLLAFIELLNQEGSYIGPFCSITCWNLQLDRDYNSTTFMLGNQGVAWFACMTSARNTWPRIEVVGLNLRQTWKLTPVLSSNTSRQGTGTIGPTAWRATARVAAL